MITYSTNWMGPISRTWWEKRGLDFLNPKHGYRGGRIDCYGLDKEEYYDGKSETSLPVMKEECYFKFDKWLEGFQSEQLLTFEEIKEIYERETGNVIIFAPKEILDEKG